MDQFPGLAALLDMSDRDTTELDYLKAAVAQVCRAPYPLIECLVQIGGVVSSALSFLLTWADTGRAAAISVAGGHLGRCPAQHRSWDREPHTPITDADDGWCAATRPKLQGHSIAPMTCFADEGGR